VDWRMGRPGHDTAFNRERLGSRWGGGSEVDRGARSSPLGFSTRRNPLKRNKPMSKRCSHDPARVVASQALFASLSEVECRTLVARSVCRSVQAGESLFREGEPCRGLYLVVEGVVRTYRANRDGQEQVFGVFGPGESLGEVSLFDEGPYLASARVVEGGRV